MKETACRNSAVVVVTQGANLRFRKLGLDINATTSFTTALYVLSAVLLILYVNFMTLYYYYYAC